MLLPCACGSQSRWLLYGDILHIKLYTYSIVFFRFPCLAGDNRMVIAVSDIVPFTQARAQLSGLVERAMQGRETIITKDGKPAVALINAHRLDHYHRLENARIHLLLLDEVEQGLADIEAGRTVDARAGLAALKARRAKVRKTR